MLVGQDAGRIVTSLKAVLAWGGEVEDFEYIGIHPHDNGQICHFFLLRFNNEAVEIAVETTPFTIAENKEWYTIICRTRGTQKWYFLDDIRSLEFDSQYKNYAVYKESKK